MNEDAAMVRAWADIVIRRWVTKVTQLKVVETTELLRSFTSQVSLDARGDPFKIVFTFLYYGIFPDMGVGKGVKFPNVATSNRRAKPWYSRQFMAEVHKLAELMAERYGQRALEAIQIIENRTVTKYTS